MRPGKILIIQLRQIGDVLLTTPVAEVLRANFPEARIDFLTQPPCDQALAGNPYIDRVLAYDRGRPLGMILDVRREAYDMVIDFMSNPRSALLAFASGAAVKAGPDYTASAWAYNTKLKIKPGYRKYNPFLKIDLASQLGLQKIFYPYPRISIPQADTAWGTDALSRLGFPSGPVIGFSPASRRQARQWPPRHFAALAKMIVSDTPASVAVTWGPGELPLAQNIVDEAAHPRVKLAPQTASVGKLAALFSAMDLVVANFNGGKHIAQAAGVPTLGICSYDTPGDWTPPEDPEHQTVRLMQENCPGCKKNACSLGFKCLEELPPETVFAKLVQMLPLTRQKVNNEPLS